MPGSGEKFNPHSKLSMAFSNLFGKTQDPNKEELLQLSEESGYDLKTIRTWFCNADPDKIDTRMYLKYVK